MSFSVVGRHCSRIARLSRIRLLTSSAQSNNHKDDCDVVIVGGGPAGLVLASALASSSCANGLKIALVEASDLYKTREWDMPSGLFSNRVSSLTNISEDFLQRIGVWDHIALERTCPVEEIQVWDGISGARVDFNSQSLNVGSRPSEGPAFMSRITENLNLQRAALRHLAAHPRIRLLDKNKVDDISNDEAGGWPLVRLSSGQRLRARLLIGADGFNSPVRAFAGIQSFGWSYDAQAIVATLHHAPRPPTFAVSAAYQRHLPTGPIACLPLSPTASSLVWSTQPALAAALTKADPAVLASMINAAYRLPSMSMRYLHDRILESAAAGAQLNHEALVDEIAFRERSHQIDPHSALASARVDPATAARGIPPDGAELLPPLIEGIQPSSIASFPLRFSHCEAYIGEGSGARTVLVGDAAHTIHPLAGQGLNGGLADIECLVRCIDNALMAGGDIGSYTALMPYTRERYIQNHAMLSIVDKLHKLYALEHGPVVWARSVGAEVLNELDTLKAAAVLFAGAKPSQARSGHPGWEAAASGLEVVHGAVRVAQTVGHGLQTLTTSVLRQAADALQNRIR